MDGALFVRSATVGVVEMKNPLRGFLKGFSEFPDYGCRVSGADDVTCLEPLGALQQIELHGFALVQRTIAVLLDCGEMNEDIFPSGSLDKSVSLSTVKPLYCTLLSHNKLLSPLPNLKFHTLREWRVFSPSKPVDKMVVPRHAVSNLIQQERLLSSAPKVGEVGAKLRSLSWWREFRLLCTKRST